MERPNIYKYLHYREYLKDMYHYLKITTGGRFSFRSFAKKAHMGSPNYLKMVIDGDRELSSTTLGKFGIALELKKHEIQFLESLVLYCKSKSSEEKEYHLAKIKKNKRFKLTKNISEDQHGLFSKWYIPAIREMVLLKGFKESPQWIARKLRAPISSHEVKQAIDILLEIGFLIRDDSGRLKQSQPMLATDSEEKSETLWNFHYKMITLSANALKLPATDRHISGMTLALTKQQFSEVKIMVQSFFAQMQDYLEEQADVPTMVCQINFQQFPVTK